MATIELISAFKDGDTKAFEELFDMLYDHVWSICFKYTRSQEASEELTHDSFILLWQNRDRVDIDQGITAYLSTITRNEVFRWIKKQSIENTRRAQLASDIIQMPGADAEQALNANMDLKKLKHFLNSFPEKRRRVFELVKINELSYNEVAEQLSISRDAVKDHMIKANRTLLRLKKKGEFLYHLPFLLIAGSLL